MTGAATVVWFLGRSKNGKERAPETPVEHVDMDKPDTRLEAQRAVNESAARSVRVSKQRAVVTRVVSSLAEVRRANHFGDNIRAAMGGDK